MFCQVLANQLCDFQVSQANNQILSGQRAATPRYPHRSVLPTLQHLTFTKYCTCHEKWTWPSPSTAPATKSDTHAWTSSHMRRHLQCAEQQMSPSKLTKYCACHAKWRPNIWQKFAENSWNVISNARPIRAGSETVPRPFPFVRNPLRNRAYFSRSGRPFCIEKYNMSRSGYLSKFHQYSACIEKWHWTSTKYTAPATKSDTKYCACHEKWRLTFTKYCTCYEKWHLTFTKYIAPATKSNTWPSPSIAPATKSYTCTRDLHQVLRLPRKVRRMLEPRHIWNVIYNARSNKCHPPNSPNTAPATQNEGPTSGKNLLKTAETSFPMRGRSETAPSRIWDRSENEPVPPQPAAQLQWGYFSRSGRALCIDKHNISRSGYLSKLHQDFAEYCACYEKWHLTFTKYIAPATKSNTWPSPSIAPATKSDTWPSPSTAPATKSDTWPSPSIAPATKSDTWPSPSIAPAITWLYYY